MTLLFLCFVGDRGTRRTHAPLLHADHFTDFTDPFEGSSFTLGILDCVDPTVRQLLLRSLSAFVDGCHRDPLTEFGHCHQVPSYLGGLLANSKVVKVYIDLTGA